MNAVLKTLLAMTLLVPFLSSAEITPRQGELDPHVRVVDYNALDVVKVVTFFGVSTHIQFSESETILDVAVGDELAWTLKPRGNNLFVKPKASNADTNLTVITNKRTYQFALVLQSRSVKDASAWSDSSLIYSLIFNYPDDERAFLASEARKEAAKVNIVTVRTKLLDASKAIQNFDYWVVGSEEISPTAASDDGRFIFLQFSGNRDMPAIFAVDQAGNESLINTNVIDGNRIVIQKMFAKLMLRKGPLVASVINKSFDINGGFDNTTGTVASDVVRVVKAGVQ